MSGVLIALGAGIIIGFIAGYLTAVDRVNR